MKKLFGHAEKKAQHWEEYDEQEYDWDSGDGEDGYPYADEGEIEDGEAYYGEEEYAGAVRDGRAGRYGYEEDVREEGYYEAEDSYGDSAGDYGGEDDLTDYYGAEDSYGEPGDWYGYGYNAQDSAGHYGREDDIEDSASYYGSEDDGQEDGGYYSPRDSRRDPVGHYGAGTSAGGYGQEAGRSGAGGSARRYSSGNRLQEPIGYHGRGRSAGDSAGRGSLQGRFEDGEDRYARKAGIGASGSRYQRDAYSEDEEDAIYGRHAGSAGERQPAQPRKRQQPEGFFAKVGKFIRGMDAMDRVMVAGGVGVLVLAILVGSVFVNASITNRQVSDFKDVGKQLDGITTIGEKGLMAVADAELAKLTASSVVPDEEEEGQDSEPGYNESGYERQVAVQPSFTSIQKDLKIKFVNKRTEKLVPNVPFSVTVTDPSGKTAIWSDDDMDGIIYKKDIASGTYKVAMEALTDKKYADYSISTQAQSVEVQKEISYKKVDVSNEVKQESEVNAKKEDTKKNEVVVESSLQDTVPWVESKVLSSSYEEVGKNTIPDPMTLVLGKGIWRMSENSSGDGLASSAPTESSSLGDSMATPTPEPTETPSAPLETPTPTPDVPQETPTPTPSPSPTPTPDIPLETPTPTPSPSPTPTVPPARKAVTVTVNPASVSGIVGAKLAVKATAVGSEGGGDVEFVSISSDNASVATATCDKGDITIQCKGVGTAKLTVKANYKKDGKPETEGSAVIEVTVRDKLSLSLDKTSLTVYTTATANITVTTGNTGLQQAGSQATVTAVSSDTTKATVSVKDKVVTVTGVAEGSATITVNYEENGEKASATCAVTVKKHPKEDKTTLLKDTSGRQIYVNENNTYREATRSDYYTAAKFYIKGEAKYTGWQTINGKVYYFTADGKKVTGEQVIQGAKYNFASDGSLVVGNGAMGIDVSKWNGNIDWNAVKNSGVSYVIIRSGYRGSSTGKLVVDPKFEANIKGASSVGLKVGIYFFSQAVDEIEAVEEASMVLGQIKNYKISYPVFLDVEASGGRGDSIDASARTAVCKAFCQTIQNAGYTAGVYSNKTWLEGKLDASSLSSYKIWLAQYAAAPTYKGRYDLWQYRSTGSVSGISGNVDMNISYLGY